MLRRIVSGVGVGVAVCAVLSVTDGCLTRPVEHQDPILKTNFVTSIPTGSIDKVDLLFDIDNSASMGDKQAYLEQAIPDLVTRLVSPNCVDATSSAVTGKANPDGSCSAANSNAEFPPVHNLHLGIVSSSLGPRLSENDPKGVVCQPQVMQPWAGGMISAHNDDQAHLLNRAADQTALMNYAESNLVDATNGVGDNFLNWFPQVPANAMATSIGPGPVLSAVTLNTDFEKLVVGVHQFGCGIESQLETWYRFLIQPDPYASLKTIAYNGNNITQWVGVDTTILQQRADFLRPDSLVAILVLTDENDSEVDLRSFGGTAWNFMSRTFKPPRGTSACQSGNPAMVNSPACTSCGFPGNGGDPSCMMNGGVYPDTATTDWGYDVNLRHVHEKEKYGVSVQFPIERYLLGLTSTKVPNRDGEYPSDGKGGYASSYQGLVKDNQACTNPLYAAQLPKPPGGNVGNWNPTPDELCKLTPGTRRSNLVFYAHIGGVPHQLLQEDPKNPDSPQKAQLTADDWKLILGNDPQHYDYTGIDPHMYESFSPRMSVGTPTNGWAVSPTTAPAGTDPISGREWVTDSTKPLHDGLPVDREYACIFKLTDPTGNPKPRQCDAAATTADPTLVKSCDCTPPVSGTGTMFTHDQLPAVCNDQVQTQQDYAKAYPTIRELLLAKLMGDQGIISSLCPIHTYEMSKDGKPDPLYGYRPAMNAIITKLAAQLAQTCLPQRLQIDPNTQQVPCLVLGTFPSGGTNPVTNCDNINPPGTPQDQGYRTPDATVLKHFRDDQHAAWMANGSVGNDPSLDLTCRLSQLTPNMHCDTGPKIGWCYIDDTSLKTCTQAILFNKQALTGGVTTSLQCIEQAQSILGGAGAALPGVTTATGDGGH